jgi:hypothetical protein
MAMLIGQLSGRKSLRDITDNLKAQQSRLYHLGMKVSAQRTPSTEDVDNMFQCADLKIGGTLWNTIPQNPTTKNRSTGSTTSINVINVV